jgi:hypothetical protein
LLNSRNSERIFPALAGRAERPAIRRTHARRAGCPDPAKILAAIAAIKIKERIRLEQKSRKFAFRISEKNYSTIKLSSAKAKMTMTDFITTAALGREIIVVEDIKPLIAELKAIGRNLNQLTTLANMNRIKTVDLSATKEKMNEVYGSIAKISEVSSSSRQ